MQTKRKAHKANATMRVNEGFREEVIRILFSQDMMLHRLVTGPQHFKATQCPNFQGL